MTLTGTLKTKAVKTDYPFTSGTTAETTKTSGRQINLIPTEGSLVPQRKKKGMMD